MMASRSSGGNMIVISGTIWFLVLGWKSEASGFNEGCGNCGEGIFFVSVEDGDGADDGGAGDDGGDGVFTANFWGGKSIGSGAACMRGGFLFRTARTDSGALDFCGDRFFFM